MFKKLPHQALLIFLIIGSIIFSFRISSQGIWHDEGFTFLLAKMSFGEMFSLIKKYFLSPPLWSILEKITLGVYDQNPWFLRIISFLATIATILLIFVWLEKKFDLRSAIIASSLFLFSPMAHFYAHEARNYSLMGFLYLASVMSGFQFWDKGLRKFLFLSAFINLLILYLHGYGIIFFFSIYLLFYSLGKKNNRWIYPKPNLESLKMLKNDFQYFEANDPYILPMDWMSGYHVLIHLKGAF